MTYCESILQIMRIIRVTCIPLSLRSKTRRRTTHPLPTWTNFCRSGVTVSYGLPFTTNVTFWDSISQTIRYWVAIFNRLLRFYLTGQTACQGLLLFWMFYSEGGATFIKASWAGIYQVTLRIASQEVLWSILVSHETLWSSPFLNDTCNFGIRS